MRIPGLTLTLILVVLLLVITLPKHLGFLVLPFAPFFAVMFIYRFLQMAKNPAQRKMHGARIAIWVAALSLIAVVHTYYFHSARTEANAVLDSITAYKDKFGSYPESMEMLGRRNGRSGIVYHLKDGSPSLYYPATYVIFDTYEYAFETKHWNYVAD